MLRKIYFNPKIKYILLLYTTKTKRCRSSSSRHIKFVKTYTKSVRPQDAYYTIREGPELFDCKKVTPTGDGSSTSSVTFSIFPPQNSAVSRQFGIMFENFTINFKGTYGAGEVADSRLLRPGYDAPVNLMLNRIIQSITFEINNNQITVQPRRIVDYFEHSVIDQYNKKNTVWSTGVPFCPDNVQNFSTAYQMVNINPLAMGVSNEEARGAFSATIHNVDLPTEAGEVTGKVVFDRISEPLLGGIFSVGDLDDDEPLYNIKTLTVTINFVPEIQKYVWSHYSPADTYKGRFTVDSITWANCYLLTYQYTPRLSIRRNPINYYNYWDADVRTQTNRTTLAAYDDTFVGNPLAPPKPSKQSITFNVVQLAQVPACIAIFVRLPDSQREAYVDSGKSSSTNTYCRIDSLSIDIGNRSAILSNLQPENLYTISVKNGLRKRFNDWYCMKYGSLFTEDDEGGNTGSNVYGGGSIVLLSPEDLGEPPAGTSVNKNFSFTVTYSNLNSEEMKEQEAVCILFNDTILAIREDGTTEIKSPILTIDDVLKSYQGSYDVVDIEDVNLYRGGSFFGRLKNFVKRGVSMAKKGLSVMRKVQPYVSQAVQPYVSQAAQLTGSKRLMALNQGMSTVDRTARSVGAGTTGGRRGRKKRAPRTSKRQQQLLKTLDSIISG